MKSLVPSPPSSIMQTGLMAIILQSRQIHNKAAQTTHVSRLPVSLPKTIPGTRRVSIKAFAAQMGLWMQISVSPCGSFIHKTIAPRRSGYLMKWAYVKEQIRIFKAYLFSSANMSHHICAVFCFETQRSEKLTSQPIALWLKWTQMGNSNITLTFNLKEPDFIAVQLKVDEKRIIKRVMKLALKW